ncbi:AAA domain-containing protein [Phocaeicola coprocola]|uniref:AAA domain-containing protein n=1 Tax=Phocaeicola coprocola TaxID=310298 RepID=UPI001C384491|nr:AAA domain-containing protein [Phocaeicola coprocola]MBV3866188.1 AAA family ATPase [Phocaeicola coprocola]MBV4007371.1 AAA family ATPase [Phocaeicola coprocola]MBV4031798.1 AAA family ATPase [Phocaeicola coprocola]MBV4038384.1 AAA family ATPase [Phocaeicola coprocola]MBV4060019.1 AAA family ATPase [Phocaeicola coprocola]
MREDPCIKSPVLYLQHQYELLQVEYEYEKEQFKQQTELMGIGRKIKRGMCWYPLNLGRNYYNALNQLVIEVERREDKDIEHQFEYGRPVCFFTQDVSGKLNYLNFVATVNYVDEDRMVVILPSVDALLTLQSKEVVGVQLYFDETSYRLMFEALKQVIGAKNNRLAELRDIFHGTQPASTFSFHPLRFPWLNATQEEAVNKVLHAKDVAIVHGPPGTGKTTTLVEAVYETLHRENQVLVCAQSNMAVDWISEKLVDRGVSVLRIGNPSRVNDKMLSFTYERRFESHPDYPQLWSIRKAIRELYARSRKGAEREAVRQKINSLKDRATELEIRINESLFSEARVIACTLVGSANRLLTGQKFGTLFIDEAAQTLEAACWIPIRKADRVILAGDHCQLPPTVKAPEALRAGLGHTLMQTIVKNKPDTVSLLKLQYRMNDEIMRFSSEWFYGGMLQSAPEVKYRSILDFDTPIEWINTEGLDCNEEFIGENYGRINKSEAELSIEQLKGYITKIGRERFLDERIDVGMISPYKAQVQYLRRLVRNDAFFKPYRQTITINTVDGFQGQERDVILISLVRANEEGQIGFLNDLRRMNVAITRARMKLIILGDASTLTRHAFYKKLYTYIESLHE